jgi:hypothetical protein
VVSSDMTIEMRLSTPGQAAQPKSRVLQPSFLDSSSFFSILSCLLEHIIRNFCLVNLCHDVLPEEALATYYFADSSVEILTFSG